MFLSSCAFAAPALAGEPPRLSESEFEGSAAVFHLAGSHGYRIDFSAFSDAEGHRRFTQGTARGHLDLPDPERHRSFWRLPFRPALAASGAGASAPFSGSAALVRNSSSLFPRWRGDLTIDFPGREVHAAGPTVHVSIRHAHFTRSGDAEVEVGS
ncbi:MAG: hypothetical protein ACTHN3_03275 [Solirubrobacterales bacterium]